MFLDKSLQNGNVVFFFSENSCCEVDGECLFVINLGDRVAQLNCEKVYYPVLEEEKEEVSAASKD